MFDGISCRGGLQCAVVWCSPCSGVPCTARVTGGLRRGRLEPFGTALLEGSDVVVEAGAVGEIRGALGALAVAAILLQRKIPTHGMRISTPPHHPGRPRWAKGGHLDGARGGSMLDDGL